MKFDKWNIVHSHKLPEVCIKSEWNNEGKGGGRERGRVRERGRASEGRRVCVSLAVKQTLNSNQLSSRQLCRTKHNSSTRLYEIPIKKESQRGERGQRVLIAFLGEYIPNQNNRDGYNVQIPRLSSSAGWVYHFIFNLCNSFALIQTVAQQWSSESFLF